MWTRDQDVMGLRDMQWRDDADMPIFSLSSLASVVVPSAVAQGSRGESQPLWPDGGGRNSSGDAATIRRIACWLTWGQSGTSPGWKMVWDGLICTLCFVSSNWRMTSAAAVRGCRCHDSRSMALLA